MTVETLISSRYNLQIQTLSVIFTEVLCHTEVLNFLLIGPDQYLTNISSVKWTDVETLACSAVFHACLVVSLKLAAADPCLLLFSQITWTATVLIYIISVGKKKTRGSNATFKGLINLPFVALLSESWCSSMFLWFSCRLSSLLDASGNWTNPRDNGEMKRETRRRRGQFLISLSLPRLIHLEKHILLPKICIYTPDTCSTTHICTEI